jgi:hypothetical protein
MRVMVSTASRRSPDLNLRSNRAVRRSACEGKRTPYNGLASVRFASRKSSGDVLKSGENDVSLKCLQPYVRRHMLEPPPARAFSADRRARVDFSATRRSVDFHKVVSEREKQSGE